MTASAFLVTLPSGGGRTLKGNVDTVVAWANDATQAIAAAAAWFDGDSSWSDAVATPVVAGNWAGYKIRIVLEGAAAQVPYVDVSTIAASTIDLAAAALVTALNASGHIAGAAYNSTTQVLTIAETTDALGDKTVRIEITPPGSQRPISNTALYSSLTHQGSSGAALAVTLAADGYVPPAVFGVGKIK